MRGHEEESKTVDPVHEGVNNPAVPGERGRGLGGDGEGGVREEIKGGDREIFEVRKNVQRAKCKSKQYKSTQLCKACLYVQ